jgi:phage baseplate assembly protein W
MGQKFIGITLPIQLGRESGMFASSTSMFEQAKSNFKNLILTKKGERLHQPELGCDVWSLLFDAMGDDITERARLAVVEAVDRWLPYLEVVEVSVNADPAVNSIAIRCSYIFRNNPRVGDVIEVLVSENTSLVA